jgi:hypothetical protein
MITTIISFLTGSVLPLITKQIQAKTEAKTIAAEKAAEYAHLEVMAQISASAANANKEAEFAKADAAVAVSANELAKQAASITTGYKWIDGSISLVRALFGFADLLLFVFGACYLAFWKHEVILTQPEISIAFFTVLGFFFGERCVKKAWGK